MPPPPISSGQGAGARSLARINAKTIRPPLSAGTYDAATLTVDQDGTPQQVSSSGATGNVTGPASSTAGDFASFDDTSGKVLSDSGVSASDATKAKVASVKPSITVGHLAVFSDTAGTIADGGAPSGSGLFNVETYGAVPNDSSAASGNDTAIAAAVAAAIAYGRGTIYFPDGEWYISAVIEPSGGSTGVDLAFVGNSPASSVIIQTSNNTGIIQVTQTDPHQRTEVRGLRMYQTANSGASSADGIGITNPITSPAQSFDSQNAIITDVSFATPGEGNTFNHLVGLYAVQNSVVTRCLLEQESSEGSGSGIGLYLGQNSTQTACVTVIVRDCIFGGSAAGIRAISSSSGDDPQQQTLQVFGCTFLNNTYGIQSDSMTQMVVHGCDFNCGTDIAATGTAGGVYQAQILGNLFYKVPDNSESISGLWQDSTFIGNTFVRLGDSSVNFIHFTNSSTNNIVTGNCFQAGTGCTGVLIDSGATYTLATGNVASGSGFTWYTDNDSGTSNQTGDALGLTTVLTLTGGMPTEDHQIDVSACHLGKQPNSAAMQVQSDPTIGVLYYWQGGSNTNTSITARFFMWNGGNLPAGLVRLGVSAGPNIS